MVSCGKNSRVVVMTDDTGKKGIVVSGMRPTGPLHIGHYFGVLKNWTELQEKYHCYFFVADWHALTTEYVQTAFIKESILDMVVNWLSAGVDPSKVSLFVQSHVPEHAELHLLFSMITPLGWLERVPSYKELQKELSGKDLTTYGFLGYPLLQTADVAVYKANYVPVGEDQTAHIELSREIIRRFNYLTKKEVFPEPQTLLTQFPKIAGLDGRKMSKSYDNCVYLSDSKEEAEKKLMRCITDPARGRREDSGNPDVCTLFSYHKLATSKDQMQEIDADCRTARLGCVDCKKILIKNMNLALADFREKRDAFLKGEVYDILENGREKAKGVAQKTLEEVRELMGV